MRIDKAKFSKALMKHQEMPKAKTGTTVRTKLVSGDILCEFYYLGLHKRLNSSKHHVHQLARKSDRLSLGKVQNQKLPILMQYISLMYSLFVSMLLRVLSVNFNHVGDCWKIWIRFTHMVVSLEMEGCVILKGHNFFEELWRNL